MASKTNPDSPSKVEPWGANPVPVGLQTISAPNQHIDPANSNIRWDFREWFYNGTLMIAPPKPHFANQPVAVTIAGGTYTAQYDQMIYYTVVNDGCASTSFQTGWYKDGVLPRGIGTPGQGKKALGIWIEWPVVTGGASPSPVSNDSDLGANPPGTKFTFRCADDTITVTVNTNLASVSGSSVLPQALVGILPPGSYAGTAGGSYTTSTLPSGTGITVRAPEIITNSANDTRWVFQNWTRNGNAAGTGTTSAGVVTLAVPTPASGDVYTANYQLQYRFVVNVNGTCTVSPATGFHPGLVNLPITVTPASSAHTATLTTPSNAPFNYPITPPASIGLQGGNWVLTVTCASTSVNVLLTSNPNTAPSLVLTNLTGGTANPTFPGDGANPPSFQAGSGGQVSMAASASYVAGGTGYRFLQFTAAPAAPPALPSTANPTTVPAPTVATVYTANYDVVCHLLNVTPNPSNGGTLGATPAGGSLAGFPNNCYAPGTVVTLTATPAAGRSFTNWTGDATGANATVQVTINAPKNVTANFGTAAATPVSIRSAPITGVNILVNGSPVTTNGTVNWANGSNNTLVAPNRVDVTTTRYTFNGWSTGLPSNTLTVNNFAGTSTTITANYTASHYQFCVTTQTIHNDSISFQVGPPISLADSVVQGKPECSWRAAGSTATVQASANDPALPIRFRVNGGAATAAPNNTLSVPLNGPTNVHITAAVPTSTAHSSTLSGTGNTRTLAVTVRNNGTTLLRNVTSTFSVNAGFSITGPTSVPGVDLSPGQQRTFNVTINKTGTNSNLVFFITTTGLNLIGGTHNDTTSMGMPF